MYLCEGLLCYITIAAIRFSQSSFNKRHTYIINKQLISMQINYTWLKMVTMLSEIYRGRFLQMQMYNYMLTNEHIPYM